MNTPFLPERVIENIAFSQLKSYKGGYLVKGEPQAVPIEDMLEEHYGLSVEYHKIRKNGGVLGQTVFEDSATPIYDSDVGYTLIEVPAGTVIVDIRLLQQKYANRLRFTYAHELSHWLIHKDLFLSHSQSAAMVDMYHDDSIEWQADALCAAILLPLGQVKIAFNRARGSNEMKIKSLANLFQVATKTM
ncbi:hypothetical protein FACS189499_04030 [Clostridia bacterium]|nr:hypothetical protein FACS189499_04030 [Clostridia bacterium]